MSWLVRITAIALVVGASHAGYRYWKSTQLQQLRAQKTQEWLEQTTKLDDYLAEFEDAIELLDAIQPWQMAPHVEKLQALNRRKGPMEIPGCFENWEKLEVTDNLVFVYLTYMKDPSDLAWFYKNRNATQLSLRETRATLKNECSLINATLRTYDAVR